MLIDKYVFNREECWYKKHCPQYKREICREDCIRYYQMYFLLNQAGIPKKRQYITPMSPAECDEEEFDRLAEIQNNIEEWVNEGNNLYLFSSNCGNYKTTWAIKLMCQYFNKIWHGNGFQCRGLFVSVGKFLLDCKRNISDPIPNFLEYLQTMRECDLVIFDDIGEFELTVYEQQNLMDIINERIYNERSCIFTSNVIDRELKNNIGPRLYSRILNTSEVIEFRGDDRRGDKIRRGV